jgi:hypothetical protein
MTAVIPKTARKRGQFPFAAESPIMVEVSMEGMRAKADIRMKRRRGKPLKGTM